MANACQAYLCAEEEGVFLIDVEQTRTHPAATVWTWKASDSPEISPEHRNCFRGYDECKPVADGTCVLVSASWNGGIAMIRRADKKCLFYARATGVHSLELIDGRIIAAAVSGEKGQLQLYDLSVGNPLDAKSAWSMDLPWAHGVVWDRKNHLLYALGDTELLRLRLATAPSVFTKVMDRFKLPREWGHDLSWFDEQHLAISVEAGCYLFDIKTSTFAPLTGLADAQNVKSIARNPATGQVLYVQPPANKVLTETLQFLPSGSLILPYKLIYKARWNTPERMVQE